ncbi:hypothetical protein [Streptomyces pseudovenezuelae]|uniref:hypothetical protein n=1 Tax=Streptomyces pseudovenezuelae TaxID=67350 RepID=UPI002E2F0638|nr:hypothetical protein [Streptomyces pseudovenezuelae]
MTPDDETWLRGWHVAPLWRVRPKHVRAVAAAHGVRSKERKTSASTSETSYVVYHLGDAQRLAENLDNGSVSVDPRWRTDTPQGQWAVVRDVLLGCGVLFLVLTLLTVGLLRM